MSYAKTDQYTTSEGKVVSLAEENKKAREMFNYGPKEQIIAQYGPSLQSTGGKGDHFFTYQNHGVGQNPPMQQGYDRYFAGSASNADEDGMGQSLAHH